MLSLSLLDLLLHRVERFRVGRVHLFTVRLGGREHLVEVREDLVEARGDAVRSVDLTRDETDELVEFWGHANWSVQVTLGRARASDSPFEIETQSLILPAFSIVLTQASTSSTRLLFADLTTFARS